jgi:hypothetical protein
VRGSAYLVRVHRIGLGLALGFGGWALHKFGLRVRSVHLAREGNMNCSEKMVIAMVVICVARILCWCPSHYGPLLVKGDTCTVTRRAAGRIARSRNSVTPSDWHHPAHPTPTASRPHRPPSSPLRGVEIVIPCHGAEAVKCTRGCPTPRLRRAGPPRTRIVDPGKVCRLPRL